MVVRSVEAGESICKQLTPFEISSGLSFMHIVLDTATLGEMWSALPLFVKCGGHTTLSKVTFECGIEDLETWRGSGVY